MNDLAYSTGTPLTKKNAVLYDLHLLHLGAAVGLEPERLPPAAEILLLATWPGPRSYVG